MAKAPQITMNSCNQYRNLNIVLQKPIPMKFNRDAWASIRLGLISDHNSAGSQIGSAPHQGSGRKSDFHGNFRILFNIATDH